MDSLTSEELNALSQQWHQTAVEKGWWADELDRPFPMLIMLMQSELAEAIEDYRNHRALTEVWYEDTGKPCGIPIELADFIIRVGDFAARYKLGMFKVAYNYGTDFETAIARASYFTAQAYGLGASRGPNPDSSAMLDQAVAAIFAMCEQNKIDIVEALKVKAEYNKSRPQRHGGKKA
jgi:hypothetical protein